MATEADQKKAAREINSLVKRVDEILWELAEAIQKDPKMSPEELDALVDDNRNKMIPPISAYLRRHIAAAAAQENSNKKVEVKRDHR